MLEDGGRCVAANVWAEVEQGVKVLSGVHGDGRSLKVLWHMAVMELCQMLVPLVKGSPKTIIPPLLLSLWAEILTPSLSPCSTLAS